jgi:hypothetical protein
VEKVFCEIFVWFEAVLPGNLRLAIERKISDKCLFHQ